MTDPLDALAEAAGILPVYRDTTGQAHPTGPDTARALLGAMGLAAGTPGEAQDQLAGLRASDAARVLPRWQVVPADAAPKLRLAEGCPWELTEEDGASHEGRGDRLPVLPMGRHALRIGDDVTWLLAAPPALPLPAPGWGITLPLYGLRPPERGGLGDYADLKAAMTALGRAGAGFVGINPVHAGFPVSPEEYSPYAPSHRRRLNVLHLGCAEDTAGRGDPLIDYPASIAARNAAQERAFAIAPADPGFEAYLAAGGEDLRRFALHQALSEGHGAFWCDWPAALQDPASSEARAFADAHPERLRFHAWRQWRAEAELQAVAEAGAEMAHGLYLDLAVGTHPHGAETWSEPDQFARGASLGAPPDAFSAEGQVWGLAAFNPMALAETGFAALAETLRCQFRHAKLLRIDHILGFERAFWVPMAGGLPGAYVTMPRDAMLAVTRIEAARAGATVIGEDLGNIPDGLQEAMAASGLLGCRIVQFEQEAGPRFRPAPCYTPATLAAFGTHDLPTWHGWRTGRDIAMREGLGQIDAQAAVAARAQRDREVAAFDTLADGPPGSPETLEAFLAATGARLAALQIEDLLELPDQPNLPGTIDEYPNWRRRLPLDPDALSRTPRVAAASRTMALSGRGDRPWND